MGFMDKAKKVAQQAADQAKKATDQGKAKYKELEESGKLDEYREKAEGMVSKGRDGISNKLGHKDGQVDTATDASPLGAVPPPPSTSGGGAWSDPGDVTATPGEASPVSETPSDVSESLGAADLAGDTAPDSPADSVLEEPIDPAPGQPSPDDFDAPTLDEDGNPRR